MLSLPKILAPIDFSERSPGAARYAVRLACQFHSELTLLHVLDSSVYELSAQEFTDPATRGLCDGWRSRTGASLADFLAEEFLNLDVRRIVLSGDPADVIIHFAHFERTNLIVLPTYSYYEPFRPFVLGSVASRVLHEADQERCRQGSGQRHRVCSQPEKIASQTLITGQGDWRTIE